jgi:ribose 5-phosphate isomerase
MRGRIEAAVSSSEKSTSLLKQLGIAVVDLNSAGDWPCTSTAPTNATRTSA